MLCLALAALVILLVGVELWLERRYARRLERERQEHLDAFEKAVLLLQFRVI